MVGYSFLAICLNHTDRGKRAGQSDMFRWRGPERGPPPSSTGPSSRIRELDILLVVLGCDVSAGELGQGSDGVGTM
jgi:hypothetical protein